MLIFIDCVQYTLYKTALIGISISVWIHISVLFRIRDLAEYL